MIKGVGRYVVEVEHVDSEFFERVICFVRPQYVSGGTFDLHREAARVADDLSAEVEEAQRGTRHVLRATPRRGGGGASPAEGAASDARHVTRYPADTEKRTGGGLLPLLLSAGGGAAAALVISAFF